MERLPSGAALQARLPPWLQAVIARGREVAQRAHEQGSSLDAAGMAYFAAIAVGPAAVVIGAFAGLLLTPEQITDAAGALTRVLPAGQTPIEPALQALVEVSAKASAQAVSITSVVGVVVALYASSRFLYGLRLAMQQAYQVQAPHPGVMVRVTAVIGTVLGLVVAAAVLLVASLAGPLMRALSGGQRSFWYDLLDNAALAWVLIALVVAFVVRLMLRRGSGVKMRVSLWSPAVLLGTLWVLGVSAGVTIYAARSSTLGVAIAVFGAPIVFLLWLYLCFLGMLMATHLHAAMHPPTERPPTDLGSAGEPARGSGNDRGGKASDHSADTG